MKILIIIVLNSICYFNSFENELAFDDLFAILYNKDTSPLEHNIFQSGNMIFGEMILV